MSSSENHAEFRWNASRSAHKSHLKAWATSPLPPQPRLSFLYTQTWTPLCVTNLPLFLVPHVEQQRGWERGGGLVLWLTWTDHRDRTCYDTHMIPSEDGGSALFLFLLVKCIYNRTFYGSRARSHTQGARLQIQTPETWNEVWLQPAASAIKWNVCVSPALFSYSDDILFYVQNSDFASPRLSNRGNCKFIKTVCDKINKASCVVGLQSSHLTDCSYVGTATAVSITVMIHTVHFSQSDWVGFKRMFILVDYKWNRKKDMFGFFFMGWPRNIVTIQDNGLNQSSYSNVINKLHCVYLCCMMDDLWREVNDQH